MVNVREKGEQYYTYFIHPVNGYSLAFETTWRDDRIDESRARQGKIFSCMPDAQKAMEQELKGITAESP